VVIRSSNYHNNQPSVVRS